MHDARSHDLLAHRLLVLPDELGHGRRQVFDGLPLSEPETVHFGIVFQPDEVFRALGCFFREHAHRVALPLAQVDVHLLVLPRAIRIQSERLESGLVLLLRKGPSLVVERDGLATHLEDARQELVRGDQGLGTRSVVEEHPDGLAVGLDGAAIGATGRVLEAVAEGVEPEPAGCAVALDVGAPAVAEANVLLGRKAASWARGGPAGVLLGATSTRADIHGRDLVRVAVLRSRRIGRVGAAGRLDIATAWTVWRAALDRGIQSRGPGGRKESEQKYLELHRVRVP